jgi:uncharacterized protein YidB (DUF937 family)
MGLLDSVIGAIGQQQGGGGGQGDLVGALMGMLAQSGGAGGAGGGLGGLIAKFQQAGLGDVANSWVSTGPNLPVSPDQLGSVLGGDAIAGFAQKMGMNSGDALGQLSQMLPQIVDKLTPNGQLPSGDGGGLGGMGDLAGMLGGLLKR